MPRREGPAMSLGAIERYNETLLRLGEDAGLRDLDALREGVPRGTLRRWMGEFSPPEGPCYEDARPLTSVDWFPILENRAPDNLPETAFPRWGMVTERCALRLLPTHLPVSRISGDRYDDLLQETALLPGEPLALLHPSRDGRWYYAAASFARGWVPVSAIGLCRSREDWCSAREMERFLVVTGSGFALPRDPYAPGRRELSLGMRLRLLSGPDEPRSLRGRILYDCYLVDFPTREADGRLGFLPVAVPISRPVHVGYLPYSPESAWALAQNLRGETYGWGGMLGGRDCSGLVQELFRCFGFRLPRNSAGLALLPGGMDVSCRSLAEKRALLRRQRPGTLLWFPGHVMLYGGERNGKLCCLSAAGRFGTERSQARAVNTVALTSLEVKRPSGETWLQALERILPIP